MPPRDVAPGTKRKKVVRKASPPPVTDVQSSGGNYGKPKATAFKRTPVYKRAVAAAKPPRQTDATSSGRDYGKQKITAYTGRARYVPGPDGGLYLQPRGGGVTVNQVLKGAGKAIRSRQARQVAPVLKVLDQTTRPIHAVAGATDAAVTGRNVPRAFGRGLANKDRVTFSKVLKDVGAPKSIRGVGGFVLDVAADPTTYTTFGASSVARKAATDAARRVEAKALKAGMSETGARTVARRAAKRAAENAKPGGGVTVKFAGHDVPGVHAATAATSRTASRVIRRVPKPAVRATAGAKNIARDVRPQMAPAGADKAAYEGARRAARQSRAFTNEHVAVGEAEARGLAHRLKPDEHALVVDAIERGKIGGLPEHLREPAIRLRSSYRHANRLRQRAGLAEGTVTKRAKVVVPKVTADTAKTREALDSAIRERAVQERLHQDSLAGFGVARGRAQVLSRTVAGARGEQRATALTVPRDVRQYAGGGHGVNQAAEGLRASAANLKRAREAVQHAETAHEATKLAARKQRVARNHALKIKAAREGEATGYFPHALQQPLYEGLGVVERTTDRPVYSGTLRRPGSAKARTDRRPISAQNPERATEGKDPFATDVPLVHLNYQRQTARAVGAGRLEQTLAETGRRLHPGKANTLHEGEAVYHLGRAGKGTPYKLREVSPADWEAGHIPSHGQFVALDRKTVDAARVYGRPTQSTSATGRAVDKATRGFKSLATFTPGFHARNLVGDTQLAYMQQAGHRLPGNLRQGYRAARVINQERKHRESLALATHDSGKTVTVKGKPMRVEDFLKLARQHGVVQSGYITRELRDLAGEATHGTAHVRTLPRLTNVAFVRFLTQDRENLVRLATFKDGLDRGLEAGAAADRSLEAHIDYADLTEFERRYARRIMPFYTFSARALPFQAKRLLTNPGKFATLEKARESIGGNLNGVSDYQQRQVPFVVAGHAVTDSLPLVLLNELPTTTNPGKYASELGQFLANLVNPIFKDPVELYANRSFSLRTDIQSPDHPLVSAPGWVGAIPAGMRKKLGIAQGPDPRSGQKVWLWPGRLDYKVRSFMLGPFNAVNQVAAGSNRLGQNTTQKLVGFGTGVRITPTSDAQAQIGRLAKQIRTLTEQQAALRQQRDPAARPTRDERRLLDKIANAKQKIAELDVQAGRRNDGEAVAIDGQLLKLNRQIRELPHARKVDQYGYATKELASLRRKVAALEGQKRKLAGGQSTTRIRSRPLTTEEQLHKQLQDLRKSSTPEAIRQQLRDEMNRLHEQAKVQAGQ